MISDKRLLLTETGDVVEDGDPAGQFLLVGKGCAINDAVARRYGLLPPLGDETPLRPTAINAGNVAGLVPQSSGDPLEDLIRAKRAETVIANQAAPAPTSMDTGVTQAEAENGTAYETAPAVVAVAGTPEAKAITVGDTKATSADDNKAVETAPADKAVKASENK